MSNNLPPLPARLQIVKSFVRPGKIAADIGTDHAYVPVWLVKTGICRRAIASDIKTGPLERAEMTAVKYGVSRDIDFRLVNGLDGINPDEADDIVIAGMGGKLISQIISACGWIRNREKHLVLQPMTAQEQLRKFLLENGFFIDRESVAAEKQGKKCYLVISAFYDGVKRKPDEFYCFAGELANGGKNETAYLEKKARSLLKKAEGLKRAREKNPADENEIQNAQRLAKKIYSLCGRMNGK